ncbi:MAG: pyridoxal kinase PdxY [Alphaproteobacteria bacterium]
MSYAVLSIQSRVAYGHVGNSAAVLPLQRLGLEVWTVDTVQFSNHTGYGPWRGIVLEPATVSDIVDGIAELGVLARCDALLTGYLGDHALGEVVLKALDRLRAANPKALYACDPVMGDAERGFFVREGVPEFLRDRVVPKADVLTPNRFELEFLAGRRIVTLDDAVAAAGEVLERGPRLVVCTSLGGGERALETIAVAPGSVWRVHTPRLPFKANGAGDVFAALFLGHYLQTRRPATALARAASGLYGVLKATFESGSEELALVAAQDEIVHPSRRFRARRLR